MSRDASTPYRRAGRSIASNNAAGTFYVFGGKNKSTISARTFKYDPD